MEIITNAGVAYQGSTPQTDNKASSVQTDAKITDSADTGSNAANDETKADAQVTSGSASNETIKKAVKEINKKTNTEAVFGIHDETNRVMIKIVDKDSKKVIKEYPPEETLDMIAKVWEMAGILVDEKR